MATAAANHHPLHRHSVRGLCSEVMHRCVLDDSCLTPETLSELLVIWFCSSTCRKSTDAANELPLPSRIATAAQLLSAAPDVAAAALCVLADALNTVQRQQSDEAPAAPLPPNLPKQLRAAFRRRSLLKAADAQRPGSVLQLLLGVFPLPSRLRAGQPQHEPRQVAAAHLLAGLIFVCRQLAKAQTPLVGDAADRAAGIVHLLEQMSRLAASRSAAMPIMCRELLGLCMSMAGRFSSEVGGAADEKQPLASTDPASVQPAAPPPAQQLAQQQAAQQQQLPAAAAPRQQRQQQVESGHFSLVAARCIAAADIVAAATI